MQATTCLGKIVFTNTSMAPLGIVSSLRRCNKRDMLDISEAQDITQYTRVPTSCNIRSAVARRQCVSIYVVFTSGLSIICPCIDRYLETGRGSECVPFAGMVMEVSEFLTSRCSGNGSSGVDMTGLTSVPLFFIKLNFLSSG